MSGWNDRNKRIINEFRLNQGKVGGVFKGKTLLLLHTKGARSQKERINPVMYVKDEERFVIVASKGGEPASPDWYYNLLANPLVTLEVGTKQLQARASIVQEPERTRLYNKMVEMMSVYDTYRRKTKREIPVIALTPIK